MPTRAEAELSNSAPRRGGKLASPWHRAAGWPTGTQPTAADRLCLAGRPLCTTAGARTALRSTRPAAMHSGHQVHGRLLRIRRGAHPRRTPSLRDSPQGEGEKERAGEGRGGEEEEAVEEDDDDDDDEQEERSGRRL
ncbi:unnamed protein product [Prorocentrum cordatum]|uniref:Uncharacterized protein n=1 Tax=Prorocentrum cordatum TaxID=2364126 RepID=A0ABN9XF26_9DINO|nr:unnamed protein product [Polarella glacialis]